MLAREYGIMKLFRCNFLEKRLYQYLAALTGSFAVLSSGVNVGWTSPYLPAIINGTNPQVTMTSAEGSWCAVMPLVGAIGGSLATIGLVNRIGRKLAVLVYAPLTFAMFILLAFARTTFLVCFARFIIGATEGALYTALPMYYGEIAEPSIRGMLMASISFSTIAGTFIINVLGFHYSIFASSIICSAVPLIHMVTFMWMPESPYYFIKKRQYDEARNSLKVLRGTPDVEEEMKSLCEAVARQESSQKAKLTDLFTVKSNRRAVLIFVILNLTKKFSGKNPFLFYTTMIFQSADGGLDPELSVIIFITLEALAVIIAFFVVDRLGRKPIIFFSTVGCAIALACTGLYFYLKDQDYPHISSLGWLPLTGLTLYNVCFSLGLEVAPTIFLGELFPTNVKAMALGLGDSFSVLASTAAAQLFYFTKDSVGIYLPFWIFSACCVVGLVFIAKYIPETKNKTLEEIQLYLIRKTTPNAT